MTARNDQSQPRPNRKRKAAAAEAAARKSQQADTPSLRVRAIFAASVLRTTFERHAQRLGQIGRVLFLAAVAAGAVAAGRLVERHVRRAEAFATTTIEIEGAARLSRDDVMRAAGLALGRNVFESSPEDAEARLREHPWVAEATVTRKLPGSYGIVLREQRAATVLALGDELLLVGEDATVLKPLEPSDPVDLPVLTGVDAVRFATELQYRTSLLVNAVGLLNDYKNAGLWSREPLSEIHVEPDLGLTLFVGKDATRVRLGAGPYAKKLRRFRGILEELRKDEVRPAYVYLDNVRRPDRVTVRLR